MSPIVQEIVVVIVPVAIAAIVQVRRIVPRAAATVPEQATGLLIALAARRVVAAVAGWLVRPLPAVR